MLVMAVLLYHHILALLITNAQAAAFEMRLKNSDDDLFLFRSFYSFKILKLTCNNRLLCAVKDSAWGDIL